MDSALGAVTREHGAHACVCSVNASFCPSTVGPLRAPVYVQRLTVPAIGAPSRSARKIEISEMFAQRDRRAVRLEHPLDGRHDLRIDGRAGRRVAVAVAQPGGRAGTFARGVLEGDVVREQHPELEQPEKQQREHRAR